MNILHTVASLDPRTGGPANSVPGLARALIRSGVKVALRVNQHPKLEWVQPLREIGIEVFNGELAALPPSWRSPDLIHDHGIWLPANHQVANYARTRAIPRVVSPRGMLEPWAVRYKRWKKRVAWWLYQRRDLNGCVALHATATMEAGQLRTLGLHNPVCVLPNGVELAEVKPKREAGRSPAEREERNSHLQSPKPSELWPSVRGQDRKVLLFLSRIHPKKGLVNLIRAWAQVQTRQAGSQASEGWVLAIAGWDEEGHEAELKNLCTELRIEWHDVRELSSGPRDHTAKALFNPSPHKSSSVVFLGPLRGAAREEAFRQAALFVLPSFSENFGIAVAEALARGLPVITTRGCPWEAVEQNHCGWWIEPDVSSLANALRAAMACSEGERHAMGARGRTLIETKYTWPRVAEQMCAVYQWLLGTGPKPACVV